MGSCTDGMKRFIRFRWKVAGETPIVMHGMFTDERWEEFRKQPHPVRRDVTVEEIHEVSATNSYTMNRSNA
jgi:hypothetical protein